MVASRFVIQASEKVRAICAVMHQAQELPQADLKGLAKLAGIPYSTLKSAVADERFSPALEQRLAESCRFDPNHWSWVDDSIPEAIRRTAAPDAYSGRDTADQFRRHLTTARGRLSVSFSTKPRRVSAFDPHMARHELTDLGQATPERSDLELFLSAHFEPFHHRSGAVFGFRKASLAVKVVCSNGARIVSGLGRHELARLSNAVLRGDGGSHLAGWTLERVGDDDGMLAGEYATREQALLSLRGYRDGTAIISSIEVNLFDRATFVGDVEAELTVNKQAVIEQIFLRELPVAEARNGWITISEQEVVVGRYDQ